MEFSKDKICRFKLGCFFKIGGKTICLQILLSFGMLFTKATNSMQCLNFKVIFIVSSSVYSTQNVKLNSHAVYRNSVKRPFQERLRFYSYIPLVLQD